MTTPATLVTSHSFPGVTAGKITLYGMSGDTPVVAVVLGIKTLIGFLEVLEMLVDDPEKRALGGYALMNTLPFSSRLYSFKTCQ